MSDVMTVFYDKIMAATNKNQLQKPHAKNLMQSYTSLQEEQTWITKRA